MTDATQAESKPRIPTYLISPVILAGFALATAVILATSDSLTRGPIADRSAEDLRTSLVQVLPEGERDRDPAETIVEVADAEEGPVPVYQMVQGGQVTGAAFELTGYGYSGAIRVLIGVDPQGAVLGVRVLAHAETPGLGDKIEEQKSDWVHDFDGRSLTDPTPTGWKVRRDGGVFDQFSGASITPRAVVGTVYRGLTFRQRNAQQIFHPAEDAS